MSFDPQALQALGGRPPTPRRPVSAVFLLRVGAAAGVAAAVVNLLILVLAHWLGWDLLTPTGQPVRALGIALVCVLVAVLAAVGAYVAARVTKRPALWVALAGAGLWLASIQGLPPVLITMHTVAAVSVVGWLTRAVRGGSHLHRHMV